MGTRLRVIVGPGLRDWGNFTKSSQSSSDGQGHALRERRTCWAPRCPRRGQDSHKGIKELGSGAQGPRQGGHGACVLGNEFILQNEGRIGS